MNQRRRIGIYGGTFDPVHLGHLEIAKSVYQSFELEQVVFVPALIAPHKTARPATSHLHRYAMLVLATLDDARLVVSTFELEASGPGYTVDTVAHFKSHFGNSAELFLIIGADSWADITSWHDWKRLLSMTNHIVATRPGFEIRGDHLPAEIAERIVHPGREGSRPEASKANEAGVVFVSDAVMMDISASEIRRAVRKHRLQDVSKFLPEAVTRYVEKYNLYRDSNET